MSGTSVQTSSPPTTAPRQHAPIPVLITARELDQGGVERDVTKIAMHLDRSRFEPHVGTFYAKGLRYEELRAAGIPILDLPLRSLLSVDALRLATTMRRYIRQHGIRIVHAYDASGVFVLPVARLARVPVTIGSQLSYREILDKRTQKLLRMSDYVPDAILVNCDAIRNYMIEDEQVAPERIELCYNGVDTSYFYPPKSRPDVASNIGTVCALRPEKNLPLLQEAFAKVRHLQPGLKLTIVGSGAELDALQENAARLAIADASAFVPATRDVPDWLRAMDIFVLPSYSEAFSNSLLEAMACGCAVVGSHVGGTPELTGNHEERGLLFRSGDLHGLATQLARLIEDAELRRKLGRGAAEFAREDLSIQIAAQRTGAIYERLLQRKNRR
ncbi:MAG TPA: glycosyltransferase family 4 protein [Candidatus Bathyarchaeia archaeon]|nr:glycosyltransferase family 4 protein [Candidatus Bathyarchaeia archaeon]